VAQDVLEDGSLSLEADGIPVRDIVADDPQSFTLCSETAYT
jgi:hypothetical protein